MRVKDLHQNSGMVISHTLKMADQDSGPSFPWPGTGLLHCVLGQGMLLSEFLSPPRCTCI